MRISLRYIIVFFFLLGCSNLEDGEPTQRSTFIKLYSGIQGLEAAAAEVTNNGYIILGNMQIARDSVLTAVILTDREGNRIGDIKYIQGGSGNAIKALPGNQGYLIIGERIKTNPNATPTDNIDIYSTHMLHINNNLDSVRTIYQKDNSSNIVKVDYKGSSLTIAGDSIIVLGTIQNSLTEPERPYIQVLKLDPDLQLAGWSNNFSQLGRSYRNGKSVHYLNGYVLWASSVAQEEQDFDFSYVSVPYIEYGSGFSNNSVFGESTIEQSFRANDIQPSSIPAFGFGIVGTRSNSNGTNSNILFARVNTSGNIQLPLQYFDAIRSPKKESVDESASDIQDYGTAITSTWDGGFVIAGHFTSTPQKGNGLNDIILIKLDAFGNTLWIQTIGGTGSETVSTIRETSDQGLLICGTNVVGGVPSIFLIKTDKNGALKK